MTFAEARIDEPLVIPYRPRRHFMRLHASEKRLRAYGNAVCLPQATAFVEACL